MEKVSFTGDMRRTRGLIRWITFVLLVLGAVAGALLFLSDAPPLLYVQILTALALVIFLLTLIFLLIHYLSRPEARERRKALGQLRRAEGKAAGAQSSLAGVQQKVETVKAQFGGQRAEQEAKFNALTTEINANLGKLYTAQEGELAGALRALQDGFVETNLKAFALDPAAVPGLGDVLADQLGEAGMRSAFDVTAEAARAIPGFDESKARSLLSWRESLESALRGQQPQALPDADRLAISEKFAQQMRALQEKLAGAETAHAGALDALRAKEADEIARVSVSETSARQAADTLEGQKREVEAQAAQYSHITFSRFAAAALAGEGPALPQRALSWVTLVAFFVFGLANAGLLIYALLRSNLPALP